MTAKTENNHKNWLLFFYKIPAKPVSNRMMVWRKLLKSGAISLKGTVYILPFSNEHHEMLQWLVKEVTGLRGEAAMVAIEKVDTINDNEIIELFNQARESDYRSLAKSLEEIARKLDNVKKGGQGQSLKTLSGELAKTRKNFADLKRIDFFTSPGGVELQQKITRVQDELEALRATTTKPARPATIVPKAGSSYQKKVWVTRAGPFVDRMASAWLIKRFIDPAASFAFLPDSETVALPSSAIGFDLFGGEFTHVGDLCTFEVLLKTFTLKEKALQQVARIVHDLDLKDAKYQAPEGAGLESILAGIRQTARNDHEALAQGMQIFELLYLSRKS